MRSLIQTAQRRSLAVLVDTLPDCLSFMRTSLIVVTQPVSGVCRPLRKNMAPTLPSRGHAAVLRCFDAVMRNINIVSKSAVMILVCLHGSVWMRHLRM